MKKLFIYMLLLLPSLMVSCQSEDPTIDICDVAWITSGWKPDGDFIYQIEQGTHISFTNVSQGMLSHKWIISPECQFLIENFDSKGDLAEQVAPDKGLVSTNIVESVYFPSEGTHSVTLYATFPEKVISHDDAPKEAYYDAAQGVWVYEHTFSVIVKGPLSVGYKVINLDKNNQVVIEREAGSKGDKDVEISVNSGDRLQFVNLSEGEDLVPEADWIIAGELFEGQTDAVTYTFDFVDGEDNIYKDFSLMIERIERPATDMTAEIPLTVKVVPTSLEAAFEIVDAAGIEVSGDVEIARGDKLFFNDLSQGSDYTATWSCKLDGEAREFTPESDGAYIFTESGVYSDFALTIENHKLYEGDAAVSTASKTITVTVNTPAFGVSDVSIDILGAEPTINILMNGDCAALPAFASANGGFTLSVTDYSGAAQSVGISSVAIDAAAANKLVLTLDAKIYQLDKVALSYSAAEGDITDANGAVMAAFADRALANIQDTNILASNNDFSFENGVKDHWSVAGWLQGTKATQTEEPSGAYLVLQADDSANAYEGASYAKFNTLTLLFGAKNSTLAVRNGFYFGTKIATNIPAGNYVLRHYVNVRTATSEAVPTYRMQQSPDGSAWTEMVSEDLTTQVTPYSYPTATNEWLAQDVAVTFAESGDKHLQFKFDFDAADNAYPANYEFWIDKVELIPTR